MWSQVRHDPGCVLLLAQVQGETAGSPAAALGAVATLETALRCLQHSNFPCTDWRRPENARVVAIAQRQAWLAADIATRVPHCDLERAWTGGLLAPLGWLAVAALDSAPLPDAAPRILEPASCLAESLRLVETCRDAAAWQCDRWGLDHTALARRLGHLWRLPDWLTPILGHLGLHVRIAERLGADPLLFQVVQLAVALWQERERGLGLPVGTPIDELAGGLGLAPGELESLVKAAAQTPVQLAAADAGWTPAVLAELLRLAVEQRRQHDTMARLQQDVDHLQHALEQQCREEKDRLQALKLGALAELAAGAGHEINNPLAVISGQAQYLLKQLALAEEQLVEDPSPTLYLDSLKAKLHKALTTIVGQSQRIHHVLTDLMQFARPATPRKQPIAVATLLRDVASGLQNAAAEKNVGLACPEAPADLIVRGDATQWRTVLVNVLRNAVEAAPSDGWVRLHCRRDGPDWVEIVIEDNGVGPAPAMREHLFDPFYSGRTAGRGRGLGLSTAWRLARQNGGEVRFAGADHQVTRFVLRLPVALEATVPLNTGTNSGAANGDGHVAEVRTVQSIPA
jgi:signal transduction histidine kinase